MSYTDSPDSTTAVFNEGLPELAPISTDQRHQGTLGLCQLHLTDSACPKSQKFLGSGYANSVKGMVWIATPENLFRQEIALCVEFM